MLPERITSGLMPTPAIITIEIMPYGRPNSECVLLWNNLVDKPRGTNPANFGNSAVGRPLAKRFVFF